MPQLTYKAEVLKVIKCNEFWQRNQLHQYGIELPTSWRLSLYHHRVIQNDGLIHQFVNCKISNCLIFYAILCRLHSVEWDQTYEVNIWFRSMLHKINTYNTEVITNQTIHFLSSWKT
jgi:hypothetical protein